MRILEKIIIALVLCAAQVWGDLPADNQHHRIHDLHPGSWNELLFYRNCSEVWGSTEHECIVKVKKIYPEDTDFDIKKEFAMQLFLHSLLENHPMDPTLRERVTILEPRDLQITPDRLRYYFLMDRLYPASEGEYKALKRLYLGCKNHNHNIIKPRPFAAQTPNHYLSYTELEALIDREPRRSRTATNIEQFCYDLGVILATIHLQAKKDGYNQEVSLVRQSKDSDRYKMLVLDFDKIRDLTPLFEARDQEKVVNALFTTMSQEYYFPFPSTTGFRYFREGYLAFAHHLDTKEDRPFYTPVAEQLFQNYTAFWIKDKLARMYEVEANSDKLAPLAAALKKNGTILYIQSLLKKNNYHLSEEQICEAIK